MIHGNPCLALRFIDRSKDVADLNRGHAALPPADSYYANRGSARVQQGPRKRDELDNLISGSWLHTTSFDLCLPLVNEGICTPLCVLKPSRRVG